MNKLITPTFGDTPSPVKSAIEAARQEVAKEAFDKNKDKVKRILRDIQATKTTLVGLERELELITKEIEAASSI